MRPLHRDGRGTAVLLLSAVVGFAGDAQAQEPVPVFVPAVTVNLGVTIAGMTSALFDLPRPVAGASGIVFDAGPRPGVSASVRGSFGRHFLVEGAVSRWSTRGGAAVTLPEHAATGPPQNIVADSTFDARELRDGAAASGSAALRVGLTRRWSGFAGGGLTLQRTTRHIQTSLTCIPRQARGCDGRPNLEAQEDVTATRTSAHLVYGLDASLTPRLTAFAELRWAGIGRADFADEDVHLASGIRLAMRTRSTPAELPEVRVIALDGSHLKGRLIAFSATDVLLRRGDDTERVPLSQVRRVEAATHRVRNGVLLGGVAGSVLGFLVGTARGPGADMGPAGHALLSGLWGAGAGASLGGLLNLTSPPVILR